MSRLDEIAKRAEGLTNLCPEYLRAGIRHLQRNCDMDCSVHDADWESCEQPDRYDGERMAKALADIPWLLNRVRELEAAHDRLGTIGTLAADLMHVAPEGMGRSDANQIAKALKARGWTIKESRRVD